MREVVAIMEGVTPTKFTAPTTGKVITTMVTETTIEAHGATTGLAVTTEAIGITTETTTGLAVTTEVIGITTEATTATTGDLGTAIEDQW